MSGRTRLVALLFGSLLSLALFSGCGGAGSNAATDTAGPANPAGAPCCDLSDTKDGTYVAESVADNFMGKGRISIVIKDHKIVSVNYFGVDQEEKIKGTEYGKTNGQVENPAFYKKAQIAVEANAAYAEQLLKEQQLAKVDAISGATVSYQQFIEAAKTALMKAKK